MKTDRELHQQLIDTLRSFRGLPVWGLKAGGVLGSDIHMQVGVKKLRDAPFTDTAFSESCRLYEHTSSLMVRCAWRLELDRRIICGSRGSSELHGEIMGCIHRLEDQVIEEVFLDEETLDFSLVFLGGGHRLAVFCDAVDPNDGKSINYLIQIGDRSLVVGAASVVGQTIVKFVPPLRLV